MVDRVAGLRSEAGTTLVELLVVIVLVGVIGSITTVGIVQSFQAQRDVTGAAESLDESRVAVQRMRDVIRGADEICANSEDDRLVVWTDSLTTGTPGVDDDDEVVIFEVDDTTNRLTREDRGGGATVLISDEIIESAVFVYDVAPDLQTDELRCETDSLTVSSEARTSRVEVQLEVNNPASDVPLTTQTAVQLRNAGLNSLRTEGLVGSGNQPPTAVISAPAACAVNRPCQFDGTGSSDPEGSALTYAWDFDGDVETIEATEPSPSHTFSEVPVGGTATVVLVVEDDAEEEGQATATIDVLPEGANLPPKAAFTYDCSGATCHFDAIGGSREFQSEPDVAVSSDPEDDQALDFLWDFGDGTTSEDPAPTKAFASGSVTVVLTVTDGDNESDSSSAAISATAKTIRVESLRAVAGSSPGTSGKPYEVTLTVEVTKTNSTAGVGGAEVTVSANVGSPQTDSCTTSSNSGGGRVIGQCTFRTFSVPEGSGVNFTITSVTPPDETYTYDAGQNRATTIAVTEDQTAQEP